MNTFDNFSRFFLEEKNKTRKGSACEIAATLWLTSKGYIVFSPVLEAGTPIDLIALKEEHGKNQVLLIDVKAAIEKNGEIQIQRRIQYTQNTKGIKLLYVTKDGNCVWDEDADKHYGKNVGSVQRGGRRSGIANDICAGCSVEFVLLSKNQKFCSETCRNEHWKTHLQNQRTK